MVEMVEKYLALFCVLNVKILICVLVIVNKSKLFNIMRIVMSIQLNFWAFQMYVLITFCSVLI